MLISDKVFRVSCDKTIFFIIVLLETQKTAKNFRLLGLDSLILGALIVILYYVQNYY